MSEEKWQQLCAAIGLDPSKADEAYLRDMRAIANLAYALGESDGTEALARKLAALKKPRRWWI